MVQILIASQNQKSLDDFSAGFGKNSDTKIVWVDSCKEALLKIESSNFDLFVADEILSDIKGLGCIEKSVMANPFLNTAAISSLSEKDFHEASEGLGVLMQIPGNPVSDDGVKLLDYLEDILKRTTKK